MGGGVEDEELLFTGDRALVWEDERVLETDGDNSYTTMYLMPLNCTLESD